MSFINFSLSVIPPLADAPTGPSAPPEERVLDFGTGARAAPEGAWPVESARDDGIEPEAPANRRGSFNYDRANGSLPLEWPNIDAFHAWRRNEELAHSIELISSTTSHGGQVWTLRHVYVCAREWSGGESRYEKTTNRERKIPSKKSGCPCNIVIKCYPDTEIVLGRYNNTHDHPIGIANARFMRLTARSREKMREMVIQKIDPREIVSIIQQSAPEHGRDRFITLRDVSRMTRVVQEETILLHPEDAISTKLWVDRLQSMSVNVFYKDKITPPPPASRLQGDTFILCMQTRFQMDTFRHLGHGGFIGIDATHNVTHFRDLLLFTIIVRDRWGHGVPVAWMLTSSGTTNTIAFFVRWVRDLSPAVRPEVIMTDRDQAQMDALKEIYPLSQVWLCLWHVLRAMRSHFSTAEFRSLWDRVKALVKTEDLAKYYKIWDDISTDPSVPQSFVQYMSLSWIPQPHLWSKVVRKDRPIHLEGDTNMLIEAYHHVLKSHWLDGKRNRRIDYILYTLVIKMEPYYQNQQLRRIVGFEGLDLASKRRQEINASARDISIDSILQFDHTQFHVASQSRPGTYHSVDLNMSICDCQDFPRIRFCKHMAAIHLHFPHLCCEESGPINPFDSLSALDQREGDPDPDRESCPSPEETLQLLSQEIRSLSENLASTSKNISRSSYAAVLEAIRSAKYSLTAAIASAEGTSALPDKETLAPNQKSGWRETATCMGAKRAPKRKCLPEERGLTERAIGVPNGKRRRNSDPYAGGERSGKRAKPDALSAEANRRARACVPPSATAPTSSSTSQHLT